MHFVNYPVGDRKGRPYNPYFVFRNPYSVIHNPYSVIPNS